MPNDAFSTLTQKVIAFRDARNWKQFHSLNHLAAGLNIEAGELQELLLWKNDQEAQDFVKSAQGKERLSEELADVLIYLLYIAKEADINLPEALSDKLIKNDKKYPVEKSYNSSRKYDALD